jgi:hypothetical protein
VRNLTKSSRTAVRTALRARRFAGRLSFARYASIVAVVLVAQRHTGAGSRPPARRTIRSGVDLFESAADAARPIHGPSARLCQPRTPAPERKARCTRAPHEVAGLRRPLNDRARRESALGDRRPRDPPARRDFIVRCNKYCAAPKSRAEESGTADRGCARPRRARGAARDSARMGSEVSGARGRRRERPGRSRSRRLSTPLGRSCHSLCNVYVAHARP